MTDQDVHYQRFQIGFWHPFGPHGKETPEEIVERKRSEITANGWTLWSFQYRKMLKAWHNELLARKPKSVFVFCSEGRGAIDPARDGTTSKRTDCRSYRFVGDEDTDWERMPAGIKVPHPFRPGKTLASAFVVERVICPVEPFQLPAVEWFSPTKGPWCQAVLPTRGEYLIRPGGTVAMRKARVVLELKPPYLAVVNSDPAAP